MLSTALHPLGLLASKGVKEGDRQDRGSSKMKVLKYTKCNTLEKFKSCTTRKEKKEIYGVRRLEDGGRRLQFGKRSQV